MLYPTFIFSFEKESGNRSFGKNSFLSVNFMLPQINIHISACSRKSRTEIIMYDDFNSDSDSDDGGFLLTSDADQKGNDLERFLFVCNFTR